MLSQQLHRSDTRVLNRRTLERDHRRLAALLQPGMRVLDVGCGTGAITCGIARRVAPAGEVLGVDRDENLLSIAREDHANAPDLSFACIDVLALPFESRFDIVTAARTLQWISYPGEAVVRMKRACRPGGQVIALDYNHEDTFWEPEPPPEFQRFYRAFLDWRKANDWDNRMGDRLPALFLSAGLGNVEIYLEDEIVTRGEADFAAASSIWTHVIQGLGDRIVNAGFLCEGYRAAAESAYSGWVQNGLVRQTLSLKAVVGKA